MSGVFVVCVCLCVCMCVSMCVCVCVRVCDCLSSAPLHEKLNFRVITQHLKP
jgi:hypothetical protein